jgi:hypothetical protein
MPVTINGTTGVVTPGATIGSINGILKSSSGVVSQAVAGQDYGQITLATAQTASGTAVDFTGIPSWAKRITVMLDGASASGASHFQIQIGSGSFANNGYVGSCVDAPTIVGTLFTTGFGIRTGSSLAIVTGTMVINNFSSNTWVASGNLTRSDSAVLISSAGSVTLSSSIDRLRLTTVNGTDTFDAGTINISYE